MKHKDIFDNAIANINWKIGKFNTLPIFFGTLMALVDIGMMSTAKMVSKGLMPRSWGIPLAVGIYALQPLIFIKAMSYEGMAVINLIWNLMSNIVITLEGVFIFGESIKGLRWVGILMSLFSLCLLAYSDS
jgi:multidrug transporter EmrE-like cation transporter